MKKVLLHICCGVCAFHSIETLKNDGWDVQGFFYNPNIYPQQEYQRRRQVIEFISDYYKIKVHEGVYDNQRWFELCKGLENEPESGKRCLICYQMRLEAAFAKANELGCQALCTTLTISPHKKSAVIFELGKKIANEKFLAIDFKKQDGFKKTSDKAKQTGVYRQNYCGCKYSMGKV